MIRVLRLIEYRYADAETMSEDMARWTTNFNRNNGTFQMRSTHLNPAWDPGELFPEEHVILNKDVHHLHPTIIPNDDEVFSPTEFQKALMEEVTDEANDGTSPQA